MQQITTQNLTSNPSDERVADNNSNSNFQALASSPSSDCVADNIDVCV